MLLLPSAKDQVRLDNMAKTFIKIKMFLSVDIDIIRINVGLLFLLNLKKDFAPGFDF